DLRPERRGDRDREHEGRERQERVDPPHHDEVERAAQVPRREAERDTDEEPDAHRDEADRERDTAAPENARKHVAAEVVGTQEMAGARRKQRVGRIDLDRIVRRDEGIACTASRPMPGQKKICSVMNAPSMIAPIWIPMSVTTGMSAFLSA